MKRSAVLAFLGILLMMSGCSKKSRQSATEGSPSVVQAAGAPAPGPAAPAKFMALDSDSFPANDGWYSVEAVDFNHNGTGQQGILLDLLYNTMQQMGPKSGFYYLLYNEKPAKGCDLQDMLQNYFEGGSVLLLEVYPKDVSDSGDGVTPAGWVYGHISGFDNLNGVVSGSDSPGLYQVDDCNLRLLAVKSTGDIPESAWQEGLTEAKRLPPASQALARYDACNQHLTATHSDASGNLDSEAEAFLDEHKFEDGTSEADYEACMAK